jgi:hypothetical protein
MHFTLTQHGNKEYNVHLSPERMKDKKTTTCYVVSSFYLPTILADF